MDEIAKLKQKRLNYIRKLMKDQSFFKTLKTTKRYKEIYLGKEAIFSLLITLIILTLGSILYLVAPINFVDYLPSLISSVISGFITLIAFSLSALALVINSFSKDSFLAHIEFTEKGVSKSSEKLAIKIVTILYRFYFSAGFNVISVFLLIIIYFYMLFPIDTPILLGLLLSVLPIYFIVFSLLFTLTLFSSCIKLPFIF